jgi:hypothetical protein
MSRPPRRIINKLRKRNKGRRGQGCGHAALTKWNFRGRLKLEEFNNLAELASASRSELSDGIPEIGGVEQNLRWIVVKHGLVAESDLPRRGGGPDNLSRSHHENL